MFLRLIIFPKKSVFYEKSVFWEKIISKKYSIFDIFTVSLLVINPEGREIRKNKNPEALFEVIPVKMMVVSSKSVNCSSCTTVPKFFKSLSLISWLKSIRALWTSDHRSGPSRCVRCSIKKNRIDFGSSVQKL